MSDEQQLTLIEGESDEALLVPLALAEKVYTATTVERNELKKRFICEMLAWGYDIEMVAGKAQCSTRIVKLLGAKFAEDVASNAVQFADVMDRTAAKILFLIQQKAPDAKFGELGVTFGIVKQRATETRLAAGMAPGPEEVLEASPGDADLERFRDGLKRRGAEIANRQSPIAKDP